MQTRTFRQAATAATWSARCCADRGDLLVIAGPRRAGLGHHRGRATARPNLPLWGGMGGAAMIGLGLALAQPKRPVLVITGDGEMLMGVGALATIAVQAAEEPLHRRARQRALRRDRHAGDAHAPRRGPGRHGQGARASRDTMLVRDAATRSPRCATAIHAAAGRSSPQVKIDDGSQEAGAAAARGLHPAGPLPRGGAGPGGAPAVAWRDPIVGGRLRPET